MSTFDSATLLVTPSRKSQQARFINDMHRESSVPGASNKNLEDALRMLATSNNANDLKVGAQMLYLYCRNIAKNPTVPRYRKLYTNNDNYRNKCNGIPRCCWIHRTSWE